MSTASLLTDRVENWEQVRDEWVAEVDRFLRDAETWSARQGWGTLRSWKTIDEVGYIGTYQAPQLLIHDTFGRLLLTPVARFVGGGDGRIDFMVIPSWDDLRLVKIGDRWVLQPEDVEGPSLDWSERVFVDTAKRIAKGC